MSQSKPSYGIDAPGFIQGLFAGGGVLTAAGFFVPPFRVFGRNVTFVGPLLRLAGLAGLTLGTSMTAYGLRGKFNVRDRMLSLVDWTGGETVLDIGTGRGLLAIGAAKQLTTGKVIGIDVWSTKDLSGNTLANAESNVRLEGVEGKVEFRSEDARAMSFADGTFDVVVSLLCLHNIEEDEGRQAACREIARTLKPGGTALIGDYIKTDEYAPILEAAGLIVHSRRSYAREAYSSMRVLVATKPHSA